MYSHGTGAPVVPPPSVGYAVDRALDGGYGAVRVLPEGFGLPALPYLLVLLVGTVGVAGLLVREHPPIDEALVLALAPWMVVGAALHALFQLGAAPDAVSPLLGTPAVYVTTFVAAGAAWLLALRGAPERAPRVLGGVGAGVVLPLALAVFAGGSFFRPWLSAASVVVAFLLTGVCWAGLSRLYPDATRATGAAGALVIFAHALDGASTAVGYDLLGAGERSPLSAGILAFAGSLPTADVVGAGWLFVLVKLALAVAVVQLFSEYLREDPRRAYLFLAVIAAVGLGPGAQNVFIFAIA